MLAVGKRSHHRKAVQGGATTHKAQRQPSRPALEVRVLNCEMTLRECEIAIDDTPRDPATREHESVKATAFKEWVRESKVESKDSNWVWVIKQLLPWLETAYGDHAITAPRLMEFATAVQQRRLERFRLWYQRADEQTKAGPVDVLQLVTKHCDEQVALLLYHSIDTAGAHTLSLPHPAHLAARALPCSTDRARHL